MKNPWEDIKLSDYENHMSFEDVKQLQALNYLMDIQLNNYPINSVMILGVAGGNGLEHICLDKINKIYGVDINKDYLNECAKRYQNLADNIEYICADLTKDCKKMPYADMVIANLFVEYIGYNCFKNVIKKISPKYVSIVIQINTDSSFVSNSPYIHAFDNLDSVHYQMTEKELSITMKSIDYSIIDKQDYELPNGKKLIMLTFNSN